MSSTTLGRMRRTPSTTADTTTASTETSPPFFAKKQKRDSLEQVQEEKEEDAESTTRSDRQRRVKRRKLFSDTAPPNRSHPCERKEPTVLAAAAFQSNKWNGAVATSKFIDFHLDILHSLYEKKNPRISSTVVEEDGDVDANVWLLLHSFLEERQQIETGKRETLFLKNIQKKAKDFLETNSSTVASNKQKEEGAIHVWVPMTIHKNGLCQGGTILNNSPMKFSLTPLTPNTTTKPSSTTKTTSYRYHNNTATANGTPRMIPFSQRSTLSSSLSQFYYVPQDAFAKFKLSQQYPPPTTHSSTSSPFALVTNLLQRKYQTFHKRLQNKSKPFHPLIREVKIRLDTLYRILAKLQQEQFHDQQVTITGLLSPAASRRNNSGTQTTTSQQQQCNKQLRYEYGIPRIQTKIQLWEILKMDLEKEISL